MSRSAADSENHKSIISAVILSIVLIAAVAAAYANNLLGCLGLIAAPFWLPLWCNYVPPWMVKIILGISCACLLFSFPLALTKDVLALPKGAVFFFGLASLMVLIASSLGLLIANSRQRQAAQEKRLQ